MELLRQQSRVPRRVLPDRRRSAPRAEEAKIDRRTACVTLTFTLILSESKTRVGIMGADQKPRNKPHVTAASNRVSNLSMLERASIEIQYGPDLARSGQIWPSQANLYMITSTHAKLQARRPILRDVGTRARVPFRSIQVRIVTWADVKIRTCFAVN